MRGETSASSAAAEENYKYLSASKVCPFSIVEIKELVKLTTLLRKGFRSPGSRGSHQTSLLP